MCKEVGILRFEEFRIFRILGFSKIQDFTALPNPEVLKS
jgi:hypothetical protein